VRAGAHDGGRARSNRVRAAVGRGWARGCPGIAGAARTGVALVDVSLSSGLPGGDGQPDRVSVQGTGRAVRMALTGRVVVAGTATLTGLPATVNISHAEPADTLALDTGAGDDTLDTSAFDPNTIGLEVS
jgi:hypothetical protein